MYLVHVDRIHRPTYHPWPSCFIRLLHQVEAFRSLTVFLILVYRSLDSYFSRRTALSFAAMLTTPAEMDKVTEAVLALFVDPKMHGNTAYTSDS